MTDILGSLKNLRRPDLLIRAARFGMGSYNRDRDLKRIAHTDRIPAPDRAVRRLMDIEAELEERRTQGEATYSPARHVDVLIALMAEARQLLRPAVVA